MSLLSLGRVPSLLTMIRKGIMKMSEDFTADERLLAADMLRSLLDEPQADNRRIRERTKALEAVLMDHDIPVPDHDVWQNELPVT